MLHEGVIEKHWGGTSFLAIFWGSLPWLETVVRPIICVENMTVQFNEIAMLLYSSDLWQIFGGNGRLLGFG